MTPAAEAPATDAAADAAAPTVLLVPALTGVPAPAPATAPAPDDDVDDALLAQLYDDPSTAALQQSGGMSEATKLATESALSSTYAFWQATLRDEEFPVSQHQSRQEKAYARNVKSKGKFNARSISLRITNLQRAIIFEHSRLNRFTNIPKADNPNLLAKTGVWKELRDLVDGHDKAAYAAGEVQHTTKRAKLITAEDWERAKPHMDPRNAKGLVTRRGLLGLEEGELVDDDWLEDQANRGRLIRHAVHTTRDMEAAMAAWQLDMVPWNKCRARHVFIDTKGLYGMMRDAGMLGVLNEEGVTSLLKFRNGALPNPAAPGKWPNDSQVANRWNALLPDPRRQKLASPKHSFAQIVHINGTQGVSQAQQNVGPNSAGQPATEANVGELADRIAAATAVAAAPGQNRMTTMAAFTNAAAHLVTLARSFPDPRCRDSGITRQAQATKTWFTQLKPQLNALLHVSSKPSSLASYQRFADTVVATNDAMWAEVSKPRCANAKFRLYCGKKVVAGFWDVPISQMLKEALWQLPAGRVVMVDEFRTSRISSAYSNLRLVVLEGGGVKVAGWFKIKGSRNNLTIVHCPMCPCRWLRPVYSSAKRSQVRGLMCSTSNNIRFYDRDVSAALNIRRCAFGPGPRPTELCYWAGRPAMPKPARPGVGAKEAQEAKEATDGKLQELGYANRKLAAQLEAVQSTAKATSERDKRALHNLREGLAAVESEVCERAALGQQLVAAGSQQLSALRALLLLPPGRDVLGPSLASQVAQSLASAARSLTQMTGLLSGTSPDQQGQPPRPAGPTAATRAGQGGGNVEGGSGGGGGLGQPGGQRGGGGPAVGPDSVAGGAREAQLVQQQQSLREEVLELRCQLDQAARGAAATSSQLQVCWLVRLPSPRHTQLLRQCLVAALTALALPGPDPASPLAWPSQEGLAREAELRCKLDDLATRAAAAERAGEQGAVMAAQLVSAQQQLATKDQQLQEQRVELHASIDRLKQQNSQLQSELQRCHDQLAQQALALASLRNDLSDQQQDVTAALQLMAHNHSLQAQRAAATNSTHTKTGPMQALAATSSLQCVVVVSRGGRGGANTSQLRGRLRGGPCSGHTQLTTSAAKGVGRSSITSTSSGHKPQHWPHFSQQACQPHEQRLQDAWQRGPNGCVADFQDDVRRSTSDQGWRGSAYNQAGKPETRSPLHRSAAHGWSDGRQPARAGAGRGAAAHDMHGIDAELDALEAALAAAASASGLRPTSSS
ncbi:hypothetical protein QJQ45_023381 [Haematococcus lacustris]|nr:hypothetical protein QJQ45_023381 [Haematococcus lacustris]